MDPLLGCDQPAVALQRAFVFTAATESRDLAFWVGKASAALACLMHAAALTGRPMTDVYQWAHGIDDSVPAEILATHPGAARGWLGPVREIQKPGRTADSIRMTITRALAWLADPTVAAATMPEPGEGFDVAEFVTGASTLYMIGGGRDDAPIAPLFRAFAEYLHATSPSPARSSRPRGSTRHCSWGWLSQASAGVSLTSGVSLFRCSDGVPVVVISCLVRDVVQGREMGNGARASGGDPGVGGAVVDRAGGR